MSVARATYGAPSGMPLGVTQAAGGAATYTVQTPTVVIPPQVAGTYMTAAPAATTALPPVAGQYGMPQYTAGLAAAPGVPMAAAGASLFDVLDRNHDGVITRAEFNASMQGGMAAGMAAPVPPPPRRLTEGLPTPASVEQQKQAYARQLESQLEQGKRTINEQTAEAKAILQQKAEEKKMQYAMQIEQQLMEQEMNLDSQTHQQVMQLHQAAFQQKAQLEQQASNLTLEYKQAQMQETLEQKKYAMQMRQCDMHERMQQELRMKQARAAGVPWGGGGMGAPTAEPVQEPYAVQHAGVSPMAGGGGAMAPQAQQPSYEPIPPQMADQGTQYSATYGQPGMSPVADHSPVQYSSAQYPQTTQGPQYGSAQFGSSGHYGQPGGTPTAGYAVPPTQYAQPPATACGVPQTSWGHAPQTSINSLGGVSPCGH